MTVAVHYQCEVCHDDIPFHGGPHRPRWCARHRPKNSHHRSERHAVPDRRYRARQCVACEAELLKPSKSGQCLFCEIENGMREPI